MTLVAIFFDLPAKKGPAERPPTGGNFAARENAVAGGCGRRPTRHFAPGSLRAARPYRWRSAGGELRRLCHSRGQDVRFAVERRDQAVNALTLEDRGKFGAAGRNLTDCAVEVNVGDQPAVTVATHHVVDVDRLAI